MLVLKRKAGESITIDGEIKIRILNGTGVVRIGIDAPKHLKIVRDQLTKKKYDNDNNNKL